MAENVLEFNDDNFQGEVLDASEPVLVDFWAEWCGPCKAIAPMIEQLAGEFAGRAKVGKLNVDNARTTASNYGISAIPTVIIFKNGEVQEKFVGMTSLAEMKSAVEAAC